MGIFMRSSGFNSLCPFLIQTVMGYSSIFFGKIALAMGLFNFREYDLSPLSQYYESATIIRFAVLLALATAIIGLV